METVNFYKIISANTDQCYVGSTKKPLDERLQRHEYDYKYDQEDKYCYITSYDILEFKDYSIELIETKDCKDRVERDTIECMHIINTANTVNKVMPGRTNAQYYRQYHQDHKEQINQYKNQKHNCNCGGKYTTSNKSFHERTNKHQTFINRPVQNINGNNNIINIYNAPHN